ncbi:MAG: FAD-dependent oxidoreductase [Cyclobacteriaceae bacterium]|nr:FAD-dependent oxidoreductase [Cyclobacteriaceae bacterium]
MTHPTEDSSICIVGGGAAGLSAAYFLKERGYRNVVVLEKEDRVGGKCLSLTVNGKSFDLGANYITSSYENVMHLARKFGAAMYTEGKLNAYNHERREFTTLFKAVVGKTSLLTLGWLGIKYLYLRWRLNDIISVRHPGFKGISKHQELCQPFGQWLTANGLEPLEPLFRIPISLMGYGQLKEIPAVYALRYMTCSTFLDLAMAAVNPNIRGYPKRFTEGYQRLWDRVSWEIEVRPGAEVTRVNRKDRITVEYTLVEEHLENLSKSVRTLECDYLIIATPLHYQAIARFLKDMTPDEEALLRKVSFDPFMVTTYMIPGSERFFAATFMVPEPALYQPFVVTRQFEDNDLVSVYTRTKYGEAVDKQGILANNKQFFREACGIELGEYYTYSEFPYFPHVDSNTMKEGFYDQFEGLQGTNRTFYAGGLMNFELVETIVNYSKSLIESNFPKLRT